MSPSARSSLGFSKPCASENLRAAEREAPRAGNGRRCAALRVACAGAHFVNPLPSRRTTSQQCGSSASADSKPRTYSKRDFASVAKPRRAAATGAERAARKRRARVRGSSAERGRACHAAARSGGGGGGRAGGDPRAGPTLRCLHNAPRSEAAMTTKAPRTTPNSLKRTRVPNRARKREAQKTLARQRGKARPSSSSLVGAPVSRRR